MARVLTAYLKRTEVPTRTALQQAIAGLPFPLTLDDGYVPLETSGYLPCTLDGEDAGFDLRFTEIEGQRADACDVAATLKATTFGAIIQRDGAQLSPGHMLEQAKGALV
ncbi:hypothetical protein [Bradyrhizobium sp. HKCCYLS20291]|uniref:hypothetical protein n=1 Tax=Bradyrhizobium sp. HKCCYLS20291 TaxID=3420766 RepID=UPI003EB72D9E